jgi:hypothetical protein
MKSRVGTSQVSAAVLLSALVGGAHAFKPPYQEIYQTTTVATANEDAILAADYICPDGWVLEGPICLRKLSEMPFIPTGTTACDEYDATLAIPENPEEETLLASLAGDSKIYIGIYFMTPDNVWSTWDCPGCSLKFSNWDEGGEPGVASASTADCVYIDSSNGFWATQPCSTSASSTVFCFKAASEDGGSVGVSQPPASVNGAAGGLLTVPVNGELILYNQYIDQSTGAESAYQFPKLTFVEAAEEIYRAALVNSLLYHLIS